MGVSFIEKIQNNSKKTFYMWAKDNEHLGVFYDSSGKEVGKNDGGAVLVIPPGANFKASWCGIPWFSDKPSNRYRAISDSKDPARACLWLMQHDEHPGIFMGRTKGNGVSFYSSKTQALKCRQEFYVFIASAPEDSAQFDSRSYLLRFDPSPSGPLITLLPEKDEAKENDTYFDRVKNVPIDQAALAVNLGKIATGALV